MKKQVLGTNPFESKPSPAKAKPETKVKAESKPDKKTPAKDKAAKTEPKPKAKPSAEKNSPELKPEATQSSAVEKTELDKTKNASQPNKPAEAETRAKPEPPSEQALQFGVSWKDEAGDLFGLDEEFERKWNKITDFLYSKWFRVSVEGVENVPDKGNVILVANHAGALPFDSLMIMEAIKREHPAKRRVRPLLEDFIYYFPYVGSIMSRLGGVRACQENGQLLLKRKEAAVVFPEGIKGITKPYRERYKLQRFGRGGFIRLALGTRSPIVPVAVIGSEDSMPLLLNADPIAAALRIPLIPITPTFPLLGLLGAAPLPVKWKIIFGAPITFDEFSADQANDRILVTKLSERVRGKIQSMIERALAERKSVWL